MATRCLTSKQLIPVILASLVVRLTAELETESVDVRFKQWGENSSASAFITNNVTHEQTTKLGSDIRFDEVSKRHPGDAETTMPKAESKIETDKSDKNSVGRPRTSGQNPSSNYEEGERESVDVFLTMLDFAKRKVRTARDTLSASQSQTRRRWLQKQRQHRLRLQYQRFLRLRHQKLTASSRSSVSQQQKQNGFRKSTSARQTPEQQTIQYEGQQHGKESREDFEQHISSIKTEKRTPKTKDFYTTPSFINTEKENYRHVYARQHTQGEASTASTTAQMPTSNIVSVPNQGNYEAPSSRSQERDLRLARLRLAREKHLQRRRNGQSQDRVRSSEQTDTSRTDSGTLMQHNRQQQQQQHRNINKLFSVQSTAQPLGSETQTPLIGMTSEMTSLYPFIQATQALDYLSRYDDRPTPRRWPIKLVLESHETPRSTSTVEGGAEKNTVSGVKSRAVSRLANSSQPPKSSSDSDDGFSISFTSIGPSINSEASRINRKPRVVFSVSHRQAVARGRARPRGVPQTPGKGNLHPRGFTHNHGEQKDSVKGAADVRGRWFISNVTSLSELNSTGTLSNGNRSASSGPGLTMAGKGTNAAVEVTRDSSFDSFDGSGGGQSGELTVARTTHTPTRRSRGRKAHGASVRDTTRPGSRCRSKRKGKRRRRKNKSRNSERWAKRRAARRRCRKNRSRRKNFRQSRRKNGKKNKQNSNSKRPAPSHQPIISASPGNNLSLILHSSEPRVKWTKQINVTGLPRSTHRQKVSSIVTEPLNGKLFNSAASPYNINWKNATSITPWKLSTDSSTIDKISVPAFTESHVGSVAETVTNAPRIHTVTTGVASNVTTGCGIYVRSFNATHHNATSLNLSVSSTSPPYLSSNSTSSSSPSSSGSSFSSSSSSPSLSSASSTPSPLSSSSLSPSTPSPLSSSSLSSTTPPLQTPITKTTTAASISTVTEEPPPRPSPVLGNTYWYHFVTHRPVGPKHHSRSPRVSVTSVRPVVTASPSITTTLSEWQRRKKNRQPEGSNWQTSSQPEAGDWHQGNVTQQSNNAQGQTLDGQHTSEGQAGDKKSPFVGYKTAYDFLSNQKVARTKYQSEVRRESSEHYRFMSEGICEIFDKHFVPTAIGGKCE